MYEHVHLLTKIPLLLTTISLYTTYPICYPICSANVVVLGMFHVPIGCSFEGVECLACLPFPVIVVLECPATRPGALGSFFYLFTFIKSFDVLCYPEDGGMGFAIWICCTPTPTPNVGLGRRPNGRRQKRRRDGKAHVSESLRSAYDCYSTASFRTKDCSLSTLRVLKY